jgi:hypothetical protein
VYVIPSQPPSPHDEMIAHALNLETKGQVKEAIQIFQNVARSTHNASIYVHVAKLMRKGQEGFLPNPGKFQNHTLNFKMLTTGLIC